jgi:hypothetical protein
MRMAGATLLASGVQGGGAHPPTTDSLLAVLLIAALAVIAGAIGLYVRKVRRREPPVDDHWRALALMGELCPHGWQVQLTVYGWGAPVPSDAPPSRTPLVGVEWKQFDEDSEERPATVRQAWARTIPQALQTMVDDRRTELTLEEIEQAGGGEDLWRDA